MSYLLLIDEDPEQLATLFRQAFPACNYRIEVARTGAVAIERVREALPAVVVLNLELPDQSGLTVCQQVRAVNPQIPVIFVTASNDPRAAIEAMKQGAYDCLLTPPDPCHFSRVIGEAFEIARRLRETCLTINPSVEMEMGGNLVGTSSAMCQVYKAIGLVAAQNCPVLITGESGTGKELVARAIHQHSNRASGPFVALNCAAIPEALLESELFGHEKGAFTGAAIKRIGKFEQCNGGTLFLDEIGDMSPGSQAKILRVLQEQAFQSVGGNKTIRTDVRLLAATHRDLPGLSAQGKFRADLYYRLSVFPIHVPPLRERGDDLLLLVKHYLRRFSGELGRDVRNIDPEALDRLRNYDWPGNVRELQSVLKRALLRASGAILIPAFLPENLASSSESLPIETQDESPGLESFIHGRLRAESCHLYAETHRQVDRLLLPRVLNHASGSQRQAASMLGIARRTLRFKLREQGLQTNLPKADAAIPIAANSRR
jgi:DNA-binding NtrC family response regulator